MLICVKFKVEIEKTFITQCRFVNSKSLLEDSVLNAVGIAMSREGAEEVNYYTWKIRNGDIWQIDSWLQADGTPKAVVDMIGHMLFFTGER